MRSLFSLALLVPAVAVAQPARVEPAKCRPAAARAEDRQAERARPRKLNEMPPARAVLAVGRRVDGCNVLLIREGARIVEEPVGRPEMRRTFRP